MEETKKCAQCGADFEASPWSSATACPQCAAASGGEKAEESVANGVSSATAWSIRPAAGNGRAPGTRVVDSGAKDSEVAEVAVVEEEVPNSQLGAVLAAGESGRFSADAGGDLSTARRNRALLGDTGFWLALAMGVMPLLLGGIANPMYRLSGLLFFFALLWGGVFHGVVMKSHTSLGLPLLAFFFTGVVGLFILYAAYSFFPDAYLGLALGSDPIPVLLGQIFQVGLCEEACKLLPVVLYLALKRRDVVPETAVLVGVFSGLGFAAFENIQYSQAMIMSTIRDVYSAARDGGLRGAMTEAGTGAYQVMGAMLLRTVSLVFLHAVFAGIAASLLVMGKFKGKGGAAFYVAALLVPALLHGVYNWLGAVNTLPAGLIIAASFVFFYLNLEKVRGLKAL